VLYAIAYRLSPADVVSNLTPPTRASADERWTITVHNDDYTTQAFVTELLKTVFELPEGEATETMLRVHRTGSAPFGTYPASIAENRCVRAVRNAREQGFPFLIRAERA